jgi:hypothetical protein
MWKKLAGSMVVAGAMSLGSVGVAVAAPASGSGTGSGAPAPKIGKHFNCANAPRALARIDKGEALITKRLPKLEGAEEKAQQHGNTTRALRIEKRIDRLTKLQTKGNGLIAKVEAKCPNTAPLSPSGSTGGTGSTSSTSSGTTSA